MDSRNRFINEILGCQKLKTDYGNYSKEYLQLSKYLLGQEEVVSL